MADHGDVDDVHQRPVEAGQHDRPGQAQDAPRLRSLVSARLSRMAAADRRSPCGSEYSPAAATCRAQRLHPLGRALGRRSRLGGDRLPARLGRGDGDRPRRPGQRRRAQPGADPRGRARHRPGRRHHPPHLAHRSAHRRRRATGPAHVLSVLETLGIDAMITLGGDGTLRFSAHLAAQGVPVISVPKTMDNDVFGTDYCIGFSTAVSRSVEAINALRTTVESHERIGVVELFGRRSGETALLAGFLAQVDRTVIAEVPADLDVLLPLARRGQGLEPRPLCDVRHLRGRDDRRRGRRGDRQAASARSRRRPRLGRAISERLGVGIVIQELAYLMRSGEPDAMDRMVGFAFGGLAVQLLERGETARMVTLSDGNYDHVPIDTLLKGTKSVDVSALYDKAAYRARLMRVEGMPMFLY